MKNTLLCSQILVLFVIKIKFHIIKLIQSTKADRREWRVLVDALCAVEKIDPVNLIEVYQGTLEKK